MLKNITSSLIVLLFMVGCTSPSIKPTIYNTTPKIQVIFTEDFTYLIKKYKTSNRLIGLAVRQNGICYVYIPLIRDVYDAHRMCIAGHELMHCVLGTFHNEDEGASCTAEKSLF